MAGGTVKQSSERAYIGTYSMKIDAQGSSTYSKASNFIDLDAFPGDLMIAAWISTYNMTGSTARGYIHFYDDSEKEIGSPLIWATETVDQPTFKQHLCKLMRNTLPTGCRYITLKFGVVGSPGMTNGDAWIDGVQAIPGDFLPMWMPSTLSELNTLGDIPDDKDFKKLAAGALDANNNLDLAAQNGIVNRGALALKDTVAAGDLDTDENSLIKVSGGCLTASATPDTVELEDGKKMKVTRGSFIPKSFSDMPSMGEVDDGELFTVTGGSKKGIYVRTGAVAMDGAGVDENFNIT